MHSYKKPPNIFSRCPTLWELWAKNRRNHAPFGPDKRIYGYHYRGAHKLEGHWASGPRCIWAPEGKDMGTGSTHTIMVPYDAPFPPEQAGIKIVALRRKVTELWTFEYIFYSYIPICMNLDELKIYYKLVLSKISENGLRNYANPWLRNIKIHIIGPDIKKWVWYVDLHNDVTVYIY